MTKHKIKLGGKDFAVGLMNIKQLREIGVGAAKYQQNAVALLDDKISKADGEDAWYDTAIEIVSCGLRRADPPMTREQVEELETDFAELFEAQRKVLEIAGLTGSKGEAKAEASTGGSSTGG